MCWTPSQKLKKEKCIPKQTFPDLESSDRKILEVTEPDLFLADQIRADLKGDLLVTGLAILDAMAAEDREQETDLAKESIPACS